MKSFHDMTADDYQELGLMAGLEIHQQLMTEKKLFCRCPAGKYSDVFDAEILRHMRPTLSELGEYDGTALMEYKTRKDIIYRINHETVCTYEMDDTPPFEINRQALDISLEIAMLLNYKLVSEIHIARKQYLDGSIPTGFQRTTIVGIDGWIPYKDRKIGLIQLGLEEDACREVSDFGHERVYLTDRLGMPLIEMVTRPEMKTPQEVAEVANILRWSVRGTGKVRRGIGAARQDVNVSISGGTRVEIKGVYRIPLIPLLIYNEAIRQKALLDIRKELHQRGIDKDTLQYRTADVSQIVASSQWDPIRMALNRNEEVHCVNLNGFLGILSFPTQTGKVFSKEISDRVRVIACLSRLPNILTSESTEETIESFAWSKIRKTVNAGAKDALILVWGSREDVRTAIQEIVIRAREATLGVPNETRQALVDGTNGFERILPGPDRMYPDTDLPPLEISEERIRVLEKNVPPPYWEREIKYRQMGVPQHLITRIALSPQAELFENLIKNHNIKPARVAHILFEKTPAWSRKDLPVDRISDNTWQVFFRSAEKQPSILEAADRIFETFLNEPAQKIKTVLEPYLRKKIASEHVLTAIKEELKKSDPERPAGSKLMGRLMKRFRGYVKGEDVRKVIDAVPERKTANSSREKNQ
jgi:glutamyl-tRNA(Gln) amidotransferase subunit E